MFRFVLSGVGGAQIVFKERRVGKPGRLSVGANEHMSARMMCRFSFQGEASKIFSGPVAASGSISIASITALILLGQTSAIITRFRRRCLNSSGGWLLMGNNSPEETGIRAYLHRNNGLAERWTAWIENRVGHGWSDTGCRYKMPDTRLNGKRLNLKLYCLNFYGQTYRRQQPCNDLNPLNVPGRVYPTRNPQPPKPDCFSRQRRIAMTVL